MKVSGLDVHKDTIFCAIYDGKMYEEEQEYLIFSETIRNMGDTPRQENVKLMVIESTGIFWIPVWTILEDIGFELMLINLFTDQTDARSKERCQAIPTDPCPESALRLRKLSTSWFLAPL